MFKKPTICCHSIQELERAKNNHTIQDEKLNTEQKQQIQEYTYFTAIQSHTHVHYNTLSKKVRYKAEQVEVAIGQNCLVVMRGRAWWKNLKFKSFDCLSVRPDILRM